MPPQKPWLASNGAVMVNIQLECSGLSVSLRNISWSYAIEGMVAVLLPKIPNILHEHLTPTYDFTSTVDTRTNIYHTTS